MSKRKIYVTRDQPGTALTELLRLFDVTINFEDHPVHARAWLLII
jgi:hypothetical protein